MIRGRPFEKGKSGNPAGKQKGTRHRTTLAIEALLEGEAEELTRKAIDLAKAGDVTALRLCMDRIAPPRKDRPVTFTFEPIDDASQAAAAMSAIVRAVADGTLTPMEAGDIAKLIETFVRTLESSDFERRILALESTRILATEIVVRTRQSEKGHLEMATNIRNRLRKVEETLRAKDNDFASMTDQELRDYLVRELTSLCQDGRDLEAIAAECRKEGYLDVADGILSDYEWDETTNEVRWKASIVGT